jgi:hypothetical protein
MTTDIFAKLIAEVRVENDERAQAFASRLAARHKAAFDVLLGCLAHERSRTDSVFDNQQRHIEHLTEMIQIKSLTIEALRQTVALREHTNEAIETASEFNK